MRRISKCKNVLGRFFSKLDLNVRSQTFNILITLRKVHLPLFQFFLRFMFIADYAAEPII